MPFPRLSPEQKALLVEMYLGGITIHAIAESEQLEVSQVIKILKEQGIAMSRHAGRYGVLDKLSSQEIEEIVEAYKGSVVTNREICVRYGITMPQLWKILAVLEVPMKSFSKVTLEVRQRRIDEAIAMYVAGRKIAEIVEETGINNRTLYLELTKRGISRS